MDCMSFVPGPSAREAIENANGRILIRRDTMMQYVNEYILNCPSGPQPMLYQVFLNLVSEEQGPEIEVKFSIRDPTTTEEEDPAGELIGHAYAIHKDVSGGLSEKLLWEVGRRTPSLADADVARAFNAYRRVLAAHQGISPPVNVPIPPRPSPVSPPLPGTATAISRALSPSNIYFASDAMFYFVDLSGTSPTTQPDNTPLHLSRPMMAFDALILSACVALAIGAPPLVFSVLQSAERNDMGRMPNSYGRAVYAHAPDSIPEDGRIIIVG
ncbi:hypothetical protein AJ80_01262 [Polytolypa hystricis UAMH7299]|uniref:Uncharacterized protein n=1 Tax=Polytolypa hystricis (strain UAMH7299) TaxID=1447883 RepID=A0A2B7YZG0_POLH7|nr:hypothetical protein AJ80_01262 [Polytolypa hystricis UAMH7299]